MSVLADIKHHAMYAIANARVRSWPFPHAIVENVLPWGFYYDLVEKLPPHENYATLAELGRVPVGSYEARKVITPEMECESWAVRTMFSLAADKEFASSLLKPFKWLSVDDFRIDSLLVSDLDGYKIKPHTDAPHRIVSMLLYLPTRMPGDVPGTSLYIPKDRKFTHDGTKHLAFEDFDRVATAPFAPSTALLFPRTNRSFHGVEPISLLPGQRRDMFLVNLRWPVPTNA